MTVDQPARIGKYEIISELGRGGMGVVYRAQDKRMRRQVAIKTITEDFTKDQSMLERFYQEAEKTGSLKHPNIVTVYDLGDQDGMPYIVMEFVDGAPLDRIIKENRLMPIVEKLRIVEQVCCALGYAHQHDVIHRDVKPANVIVQHDGVAKLLDFGIAREEKRGEGQGLTRTGQVIGTVPYMAPERLKGSPLDGRSDIFAAGVLLYQALTGQLPFQGDDSVLVSKILGEQQPPLSTYLQNYPAALDAIVERSLAKNPDARYTTAEEMAADLGAVIDNLKREHVSEMIVQVKHLLDDQQYIRARDALQQLLRLDSQHAEARRMLVEVQQTLARKLREEQAQKLTIEAEDALRERNLDHSIELLEEACKLVPDDTHVADLLESTRKKKQIQEQVDTCLRRADAAKSVGDYAQAKAIVAEAMALDAEDSRVQAAFTALARQAELAAQRAKARELMDKARAALKQRTFDAALTLLREAEAIEPLHPELQSMMASALAGTQQEERRKLLDRLEGEVTRATTYEQSQALLEGLQTALDSNGNDPAILKMQAHVRRQIRDFESKKLVEDTLRDCRAKLDASPAEALKIVRAALTQLPADEHLISLQATVEDRLARMSQEEQRASYLNGARKALAENRFHDAVNILESCTAELRSVEIAELLDFARQEEQHEADRKFVSDTLAHAQQLMRDNNFQEAIAYLEPVVARTDEPAIRSMLDQARSSHQAILDKAATVSNGVEPLMRAEAYDHALSYLEALPREVKAVPAIQAAIEDAKRGMAAELETMVFLGGSYASLASTVPSSAWKTATPADALVPTAGNMFQLLEKRRRIVASQRINGQMEVVKSRLVAGDVRGVDELLEQNAATVAYADQDLQAAWATLANQHRARKNSGIIGKFGRKSK